MSHHGRPADDPGQHGDTAAPAPPSPTGDPVDYIRGYETMSRQRIVEIAANRAVIERVKGLLMFVYDLDADHAFELLRRRARSTQVRLRSLAEQLMTDVLAFTPEQRVDLRSSCDQALLTAHRRIRPDPTTTLRPDEN